MLIMSIFSPLIVLLFGLVVASADEPQQQEPLAVEVTDSTNGNTYLGERNAFGGVDSFLGIQYATIPERFEASQVVSGNLANQTLRANEFGLRCVQPSFFGPPLPQSEDCLFLNIWRPTPISTNTTTTLLPVMVWIHGGGYTSGAGSEPLYEGTTLARDGNVLVVTLNYRLGVLGFMVTDLETGLGGANGHHDQINALQWVQDNIEYFGGDPENITIFGESVGGVSVCLLAISPMASGLFHRAIIQSGQCITERLEPLPTQVGIANTLSLLNQTNSTSIEDLKTFPVDQLLQIAGFAGFRNAVIDGWIIPDHPLEFYNSGQINPQSMIIGANTIDDPAMLGFPPDAYVQRSNQMESYIHGLFDERYGVNASDAILAAYSPSRYNGSYASAYAHFSGDFLLRCGSRELSAIIVANSDVQVYHYIFAQHTPNDIANGIIQAANITGTSGWASHTVEVPFVYGNLDQTYLGPARGPPPTAQDEELSQEIISRWAAFSTNGNPNHADLEVEWVPVTAQHVLDTPSGEVSDIPVLAYQNYRSVMETSLPQKTEQCSSMPEMVLLRAEATSSPSSSSSTADGTSTSPPPEEPSTGHDSHDDHDHDNDDGDSHDDHDHDHDDGDSHDDHDHDHDDGASHDSHDHDHDHDDGDEPEPTEPPSGAAPFQKNSFTQVVVTTTSSLILLSCFL